MSLVLDRSHQMPEINQPIWQRFEGIRGIGDVHGDAVAVRTSIAGCGTHQVQ